MTATSPLTIDVVLEAARKLSLDDQYELVNRLDNELHGGADTQEWEDELNRRVAEVESGTADLIPAEEVLAELRGMLRKSS